MIEQVHRWLSYCNYTPQKITQIKGDASFRSFYRVYTLEDSYILMFLDPSIDTHEKFVDSSNLLNETGAVPKILELNLTKGWLLMEDFGDVTLNAYIKHKPTELTKFYKRAIDNLLAIQKIQVPDTVKPYSIDILNYEMDLFIKWYLQEYKKIHVTHELFRKWELGKLEIIKSNIRQPHVLVHRDYHSRNLMVLDNAKIGVIDHQDILFGPISYDIVSLLKDAYVKLKKNTVEELLEYYYTKAKTHKLLQKPYSEFKKDFDLMGLQRHLKILGLFCRLSLRDSKHSYLKDLPLTEDYVVAVARNYKNLNFIEEVTK